MSEQLLELFYQFQGYMYTTVIAVIAMMLVLLLLALDYDIQNWRTKLLGVFAGLDTQDALKLSCSMLKFIFIAYSIISSIALGQAHYLYLLMLIILTIVLKPRPATLFFNLINNGLLTAGLVFGNAISQFINQVRYELEVVIVYWLWGIFLILYGSFIFLHEISQITLGKKVYKHEQYEKPS